MISQKETTAPKSHSNDTTPFERKPNQFSPVLLRKRKPVLLARKTPLISEICKSFIQLPT